MYKMTVSASKPIIRKVDNRYDDLPGRPVFRTGMMTVYNGKPNRNPITVRFMAEAVVPFPFTGTARESLDRKGYIPTPTVPDTARKTAKVMGFGKVETN